MKINKSELQNALEKVKPGLAQKELIEQATSFTFLGDRVVTYNDEISISHPVEGLNVTGAIKAQALYDFLNKVKKDEIDIEWQENQVIIKAGRTKAGLVFEQEVKLPLEEEIGEIGEWQELPENTLDALKLCHPCTSKDMSRPVLTCVHVGGNVIEASDSYQIIRYEMKEEIPASFLIPANSVKELVKYDVKEMAKGDSWIHFKTEDGTIFSARIIGGEFPDTSSYLDIEGAEFRFPETTKDALDRANVFAKDDNSAGDIPVITVAVDGKKMDLSTKNSYGWFEEKLKTDYEGEPFQFVVGIEFMIALFEKLKNCIIGEDRIGFSGENWKHVIAMQAGKEEE